MDLYETENAARAGVGIWDYSINAARRRRRLQPSCRLAGRGCGFRSKGGPGRHGYAQGAPQGKDIADMPSAIMRRKLDNGMRPPTAGDAIRAHAVHRLHDIALTVQEHGVDGT